jgi:hypothetical protein
LKRPENGGNVTVYMAGWGPDWGNTGGSGFFTDKETIDSCIHNGKLNTNELDSKLQTALSDFNFKQGKSKGMEAHSHVSAYTIDFRKLDEFKTTNPTLHDKLTSPDGRKSDDIKVAYGKVQANTNNGIGGGNQYYMEPKVFAEAKAAGLFRYKASDSFSVTPNAGQQPIDRAEIPKAQYDADMVARKPSVEAKADEHKTMMKEGQSKGFNKEDIINRFENNPRESFIAKPDESYGYANRRSKETDKQIKSAEEKKSNTPAPKRAMSR